MTARLCKRGLSLIKCGEPLVKLNTCTWVWERTLYLLCCEETSFLINILQLDVRSVTLLFRERLVPLIARELPAFNKISEVYELTQSWYMEFPNQSNECTYDSTYMYIPLLLHTIRSVQCHGGGPHLHTVLSLASFDAHSPWMCKIRYKLLKYNP